MAFNAATFRKRTLSAILFVIIMMAGILWNVWSFFILFSIIHVGCWIEWQRLIGKIDSQYSRISIIHKYTIIVAGWCLLCYFLVKAMRNGLVWRDYCIATFAILLLLIIVADVWKSVFTWKNFGYSVAGLGYVSLSWALMVDLRVKGILWMGDQQWDLGWIIPMVLIASIWINDTMAYIVGSLIGKTRMSSISPNKTWEGTIGGAVLAIVVVTAIWYFFVVEASWMTIAGIAAIAAIAGTIGDLFESKLKRLANVKDSGNIMPGHGGFLDRFDSLLIATPLVWLFLYIQDKA